MKKYSQDTMDTLEEVRRTVNPELTIKCTQLVILKDIAEVLHDIRGEISGVSDDIDQLRREELTDRS